MKISIVCPFYNEEAIIAAATKRMIGNLDKQIDAWELILVNDGSRDCSLEVLLASLNPQQLKRVRVISCPVNQGRGRALKNGIDAAIGDVIVTTEADCSWGDDIVLRLVNELTAHPEAHFIVASPHLPGGGLVNVPLRRRLLTAIGNRLIRAFFTSKVTMNTGMTRAYRREVVQPLEVWENGKEFHLEVLLKLVGLGFRVREIPACITWQEHKLAAPGSAKRVSSTRIFKTIGTHMRFLAIAKPTQYFRSCCGNILANRLCFRWMGILESNCWRAGCISCHRRSSDAVVRSAFHWFLGVFCQARRDDARSMVDTISGLWCHPPLRVTSNTSIPSTIN